jgi:peptidoglycan/LPS O-acetylase OafA/YrhL
MMARTDNRFDGLEVLRFLSAFAVFVWHYQHFFQLGSELPAGFARDSQPFYKLLCVFYNYGAYGVQVFWAISGFIFFWKYAEAIRSGAVSAGKFFLLRFSRLYPLHFATLIAVALLQPWYFVRHGEYFTYPYNDIYHFVLQLFFVSHWGLHEGHSFNAPIWSISIEVLVYGIFFLVAARMRFTLLVCVLLSLLFVAVQLVLLYAFKHEMRILPISQCVLLFFGGGGCYLVAKALDGDRWAARRWLALFAALSCALYVSRYAPSAFKLLPVYLLAISAVLGAYFVSRLRWLTGALRRGRVLGDMTYSSYLTQFPLQLALVIALDAMGVPRRVFLQPSIFLLFGTCVFGLAWCCYRYFEAPAQDWIRRRFSVARAPTGVVR